MLERLVGLMNTLTHSAWTILEELAEVKVADARELVADATYELSRISKQKLQLLELLDEYKEKLVESQTDVHSITDNIAYRHFIKQVNDLLEVINKEEKDAEKILNDREELLIDALKEQKKAEFLNERQALIVKTSEKRSEQKRLDEIGIARFNQSSHHGLSES